MPHPRFGRGGSRVGRAVNGPDWLLAIDPDWLSPMQHVVPWHVLWYVGGGGEW